MSAFSTLTAAERITDGRKDAASKVKEKANSRMKDVVKH